MTRRFYLITTDSFGGRGGIALYNCNLMKALSQFTSKKEIIHFARSNYTNPAVPDYINDQETYGLSKLEFALKAIGTIFRDKRELHIICAHLNLFPLIFILRFLKPKAKITLITYGFESWHKRYFLSLIPLRWIINNIIYIRQYSFDRFKSWAKIQGVTEIHLPNFIDLENFSHNYERNYDDSIPYICTTGRMDSDDYELRKGFDEIIEILPQLTSLYPNIRYKIVGDGPEQENLLRKAELLSVDDRVDFLGYLNENDRNRVVANASLFAMPGSNPAFDKYPIRFSFLEAMALGTPVLMGKLKSSDEIYFDKIKEMAIITDENNQDKIVADIKAAIEKCDWDFSAISEFGIESAARRLEIDHNF